MKKIKLKKSDPIETVEKGEATQEMEAIMDAASGDTTEIDLLLDIHAPKEELPTDTDTNDGIDDIPDAFDAPAENPEQTVNPPVSEADSSDVPSDSEETEDDTEDELQPTEPAPDEELPAD